MEAEIIHAVGVCFDVRESQQYHPRRRRAGCLSLIRAEGAQGAADNMARQSYRIGAMRASLWRRYWK